MAAGCFLPSSCAPARSDREKPTKATSTMIPHLAPFMADSLLKIPQQPLFTFGFRLFDQSLLIFNQLAHNVQ